MYLGFFGVIHFLRKVSYVREVGVTYLCGFQNALVVCCVVLYVVLAFIVFVYCKCFMVRRVFCMSLVAFVCVECVSCMCCMYGVVL